jgi:molecular chaperone DnaJ
MGRGTTIDDPCPECHGEGQILRDESLTVRIPVGVEEGTALRVPDHGMPPADPRGKPGDLYVVVRSAPDARFTRQGADLWRTEKIEVVDAALGTIIKVPTLDGVVDVKVPAGTQPEAVLPLRGKGLPEFGGARYGDLFLRLQVHIPEKLSRKEREAFEDLQRLARNKR